MNPQESKKLEKDVFAILEKYLAKEKIIVLGLSGGPDSLFLFQQLLKFKKRHHVEIVVAHLNHKLRKEADLEANLLEKTTGGNNCIFEKAEINIKNLSGELKKGLEETGRIARYHFFEKIAAKHRAKFILTAHHADDNLETILMNFTRGSGLKGLSGMNTIEKTDKKTLFRPLLNIAKQKIVSYLDYHRIHFFTDKTNFDKKYKRNRIRHDLIPLLEKINPNLSAAVARNTENLREINQFMEEKTNSWLKNHKIVGKPDQYDAKSFRKQHPALQKQILIALHQAKTGNTINLEKTHLDEVISIIRKGHGNKKKKMGKLVVSIKNSIIHIH